MRIYSYKEKIKNMEKEIKFTPTKEFDIKNCTLKVADRSVMAHCHYFMDGVLKTILEIKEIDGGGIYKEQAEKAYAETLRGYLGVHPEIKTEKEKLALAQNMYTAYGFGKLTLDGLTEEGGKAHSDSSFFVTGWLARYGRYDKPLCFFASGFIAGALSVIFDKSTGAYSVKENQCLITGVEKCEFEVRLS